MHYLNTDNTDEILEAINAVEHSLVFSSRRKLISKMKAINFIEVEREENVHITFKGYVNSQTITLFFTIDLNDLNDKAYYLTEKRFYKPAQIVNLPHRDHDLPAILRYYVGERFSKCKRFSYYINGHHTRINKRDPITINHLNDSVEYSYYIPIEMMPNDIYMHSIVINENSIISCIFQCADFEISLEKLKSILPEIESFTLQDLIDLNDRLNDNEKSLIQMVNV